MADSNGNTPHTFEAPASVKKYRCPVHGVTEHVIHSNIPGHEGHWCQICWVDSFEKAGVSRVEEAPGPEGTHESD